MVTFVCIFLKGVELSHRNIVSNLHAIRQMWPKDVIEIRRHSLNFLPWAHIFGMTTSLHGLLAHGSCSSIVPHRDQILECLAMAKPSQMSAVPLMLNRVSATFTVIFVILFGYGLCQMYNGVHAGVAQSLPHRRFLVKKAFEIARKRNALVEAKQVTSCTKSIQVYRFHPFIHTLCLACKLVFDLEVQLGDEGHNAQDTGADIPDEDELSGVRRQCAVHTRSAVL